MKRKIRIDIVKTEEMEIDIPDYEYSSQENLRDHVFNLILAEHPDFDDWDWIGAEPFLSGEEVEPQAHHYIEAMGCKWVTDGCGIFRSDVQPIKQNNWRKSDEKIFKIVREILLTDLTKMPNHKGYFAAIYQEFLSNPDFKVLGKNETSPAFVLKKRQVLAVIMPAVVHNPEKKTNSAVFALAIR